MRVERLLVLGQEQPRATITMDELEQAQVEAEAMPLSDDAREAIITIKHELEREGVSISDRRLRSCGRLVKAAAWVRGETATSADHCEALVDALRTEPGQRRVVERVVARITNPLHLEAVELEDAAKDLYDQKPKPDEQNLTAALEPLLRQLADIHTRLEQRISTAPATRTLRARQALGRVDGWHRELSQMALRSLSRLHIAPGA